MAQGKISIETAVTMLATFDGTKSKLHDFCDTGDKAMRIIQEEYKDAIFCIIETKITGRARALIRNRILVIRMH